MGEREAMAAAMAAAVMEVTVMAATKALAMKAVKAKAETARAATRAATARAAARDRGGGGARASGWGRRGVGGGAWKDLQWQRWRSRQSR